MAATLSRIYTVKNLKYHLIFDLWLLGICLLSMILVRSHFEGETIFDYLFLSYAICSWSLFLHQLIILDAGKAPFAYFFLFVLYLVLGFFGSTVFIVRTFAW